ncbi:WD40-repeat-containing domain protein [Gorgonomyces haynaldii]|nr:WD40-repeat-containing domain protein [Gorgonomyces haynaldii]
MLPQEQMLPLIVSQLKQYGYFGIARNLQDAAQIQSVEPSNQLAEFCASMEVKQDENTTQEAVGHLLVTGNDQPVMIGNYSAFFTTQHRGPVRSVAFSGDGRLIATGSEDSSLKVLDADRVMDQSAEASDKVIKTLYDHTLPVNEVKFHPNGVVLASCSDDTNIKLFDLGKAVKRAFRFLPDAYPVRSIDFHPSGDFLISGSDHHAVRIFDIHTLKCYVPPTDGDHHESGITKVRYAPMANIFASSSHDGSIKIYDGVSSSCINTIYNAHNGLPVTSIEFSKSGRYLLSTGMDHVGRLWDMSTGKVVVSYTGGTQTHEMAAMSFTHDENHVVGPDDDSNGFIIWDARTGSLLRKNQNAHNKKILSIAASPTDGALMTGSEDARGKYWNLK